MKNLFFIVDCSGSIGEETMKIGQINDLLRDTIDEVDADSSVICYADDAKVYWQAKNNSIFVDIPHEDFIGRSNLGKAYDLVKEMIENKAELEDCIFVLISDGQATDNYKKSLSVLDPKKKATRLAFSIGTVHTTTERHVSNDTLLFKNILNDRDEFIEKIKDLT